MSQEKNQSQGVSQNRGKRQYVIRKIPDEGYMRKEKMYFVSIEEGKTKVAPCVITWTGDIRRATKFEHIADVREMLAKTQGRMNGQVDVMTLKMAEEEDRR